MRLWRVWSVSWRTQGRCVSAQTPVARAFIVGAQSQTVGPVAPQAQQHLQGEPRGH